MTALPPLLITSAVTVTASLTALTDRDARISLTVQAIEHWLRIASDIRIVICDGSNFDFSKIMSDKFPNASIECHHFTNSQDLVALRGKGFGEGEIIKYALEHSTYLRQSDHFAKCTSKLWVTNFLSCIRNWNGFLSCNCLFLNYKHVLRLQLQRVDTRFYIISRSLYLEYFASAHLSVNDGEGRYLEVCFKDVVVEKRLGKLMSPIFPFIEGVSGSSGTRYAPSVGKTVKYMVKKLVLKIALIV